MDEGRDDKAQKPRVVTATDGVADPRAVVIPPLDAAVGLAAVRGARWPLEAAGRRGSISSQVRLCQQLDEP